MDEHPAGDGTREDGFAGLLATAARAAGLAPPLPGELLSLLVEVEGVVEPPPEQLCRAVAGVLAFLSEEEA